MEEIKLITIERNPGQTVMSVVKLFGFRVRGNSVYIFFGGLSTGVLAAMMLYPVHILVAGTAMIVPPVLAAMFIRKFVSGKPRYYFSFWLDAREYGCIVRKPKKSGCAASVPDRPVAGRSAAAKRCPLGERADATRGGGGFYAVS